MLKDLSSLEEAVGPSFPQGLAELCARLGSTRTHIAEHFRFEEENGYMEVVRKRDPRFERVVEQLAQEHRMLAESLDRLIREAGASAGIEENLRHGLRTWIQQVRHHEARENDLIQDAFCFDIGAED